MYLEHQRYSVIKLLWLCWGHHFSGTKVPRHNAKKRFNVMHRRVRHVHPCQLDFNLLCYPVVKFSLAVQVTTRF